MIAAEADQAMLLTIPEACRRLRISRATFYRELDRGRIEVVTIGTAKRVTPRAIQEYVDLLTREARGEA